jgi:hypothetical protein
MDVLLHGENTHTLVTRALVLTHTRRRCDGCKSVSDCFLPPPHRNLYLDEIELSVLPDGIFSRLTSLRCLYICRVRTQIGKSEPDCVLPPPHRHLSLGGNQLSVLPAGIFSNLTSLM